MNYVAESRLSEALDIGVKAVRLRAMEGGWPVRRRKKQGGNELFYVRDLLPLAAREKLAQKASVDKSACSPSFTQEIPIPRRSDQIGMAKYNLVHAYRLAKERAPWGGRGKAAQDFLLAYNTGLVLPQVHAIVGEIRPRTIDALDKKLRDNNDNYRVLCDGRGGWKKHGTNKYKGRKLTETEKAVFLKCYLHGARPSVSMAIRAARAALARDNQPVTASDSTFHRWLKDYRRYNAGVICLARDGMKAYQDQYGPYISRDAGLLTVGQCLVADGKTLNFTILHPETGRPCRMTLIVFFDWKSRYPCGWHIMPTEDQYGILSAFRNAVVSLGRYPDSVYLDNGRAFKSKLFTRTDPDFTEMTGLYARVGTAVIFAKPYNGRAKVVERFFRTVQDQLEFMMPSYCGDSIQTRPPWMHRNETFHKTWHRARTKNWVPTLQEAALIIDRYFHWYGQQVHQDLGSAPADLFLPERGSGVDPVQLNYDFLLRKAVRPRNCRITLWKIEYESDCLHNLSPDEPIWAAVDTADLRTVFCYTRDGIFLGEARPVQACHPLARMFGDQVALDRVVAQNKRQARLARANKRQLASMGITKETRDSLDMLSFAAYGSRVPVCSDTADGDELQDKKLSPALEKREIKRLADVAEQAALEMRDLPRIQRSKYWSSDLEHYEWVFRYIFEHGRDVSEADAAFMKNFETLPEFENYRQRFEDLKLVFNPNQRRPD